MPETYDKPFKTYKEQIEIMRSRNVSIPEDMEKTAVHYLSSISYYTLMNSYKNTPLIESPDKFIDGTTVPVLVYTHVLNKSIRSILLKYILYIEKSFKTKLAYEVSSRVGIFTDYKNTGVNDKCDYLSPCHYKGTFKIAKLKRLKECIANAKKDTSLHYYREAKNHVPAWILSQGIYFHDAIMWYGILKPEAKRSVCFQMLPESSLSDTEKLEFFPIAMNLLRKYRNAFAHEENMVIVDDEYRLPKKSLLKMLHEKTLTQSEYEAGWGQKDIFAAMILICLLIKTPYLADSMLAELSHMWEAYKNTPTIAGKSIFEIFRLPENLIQRLNFYFVGSPPIEESNSTETDSEQK